MPVETRHRFSVKEYYRMAETGVLKPDARVELLNGDIIEVYREPHFTGYGSRSILRAGEKAAPRAFPEAAVDVAELLKH